MGYDDDEEAGDGGDFETNAVMGKECVIFLVDCSAAMSRIKSSESTDDELTDEPVFNHIMKLAKRLVSFKVKVGSPDLFGIVLYSSEKAHNTTEFKNIFVLQDLEPLGKGHLENYHKRAEISVSEYQSEYGQSKDYSLADAMWTCSTMFSKSKGKLAARRLIVLTANDNPHGDSLQKQNATIQKAKDLKDIGITIEVVPLLTVDNDTFELKHFYQDVVNKPDEVSAYLDCSEDVFDILFHRVTEIRSRRRCARKILFCLNDNIKLAVGMFSIITPSIKPRAERVENQSYAAVKSVTKHIDPETDQLVSKDNVTKSRMVGGQQVVMGRDDLRNINRQINKVLTTGGPVIKNGGDDVLNLSNGSDGQDELFNPNCMISLRGFLPATYLKVGRVFKTSYKLYPEESAVKGSSSLYTALVSKCLEKNMIALCLLTQDSVYGIPQFVALLPKREQHNEKEVYLFNMIYLPYQDDIRKNLPDEAAAIADDMQVAVAAKIVKKLHLREFDCRNFKNPGVAKHWLCMETKILKQVCEKEEDLMEPFVEDAVINPEKAEKRIGGLIGLMKQALGISSFPTTENPSKGSKPASKRSYSDKDSSFAKSNAEKKARVANRSLEDLVKSKSLKDMTVAQLKEAADERGIKVNGKKKDDLMQAIYDHFG